MGCLKRGGPESHGNNFLPQAYISPKTCDYRLRSTSTSHSVETPSILGTRPIFATSTTPYVCLLFDLSGTKFIVPEKSREIFYVSLVSFEKLRKLRPLHILSRKHQCASNDVNRGSNCGAGNRLLLLVLIVKFSEWPLEKISGKLGPDGLVADAYMPRKTFASSCRW